MKTVNISELKNRLSHYLRLVRRGEALLVCDRDRVIARIEPAGGSAVRGEDDEWLAQLERDGIIRRGKGKLSPAWMRQRPRVKADVVQALIDERERGR
jgi:antitoxin (DNA-binding transcriptional repressor) of toxin-antitoxin stability system